MTLVTTHAPTSRTAGTTGMCTGIHLGGHRLFRNRYNLSSPFSR